VLLLFCGREAAISCIALNVICNLGSEEGSRKMGHLYTDMTVRGDRGAIELKEVLIDTWATYTVLPEKILEEVGAARIPGEVEVEIGNGQKIKAKAYGVAIKIKGVEAPAISITFEGARAVIGVEALESIGLRLDPTTGELEFTRPKGLAYFFYHAGNL
jgi:predicted aspartyl protease